MLISLKPSYTTTNFSLISYSSFISSFRRHLHHHFFRRSSNMILVRTEKKCKYHLVLFRRSNVLFGSVRFGSGFFCSVLLTGNIKKLPVYKASFVKRPELDLAFRLSPIHPLDMTDILLKKPKTPEASSV